MSRLPAFLPPPRVAAGVLVRVVEDGDSWYLLGKRHARLGGTWANIGGSVDSGERAIDGALREFTEELGLPAQRLRGATITAVVESKSERVDYTLFVLDLPGPTFSDGRLSWEHTEAAWITSDEIDDMRAAGLLHDGFAAQWNQLRSSGVA